MSWGVESPSAPAPESFDDAGVDGPRSRPRSPICTEPWTSLYALRRGTLPCCYGGPVLAPMASFQDAWNAPIVQEIRRDLRDGRFHAYCFDSPDCPIVRKAQEGGTLGSGQSALLVARRGLSRLRRAGSAPPEAAAKAVPSPSAGGVRRGQRLQRRPSPARSRSSSRTSARTSSRRPPS